MLETFWDSRVDLIDRKWSAFSGEIKTKAKARKDKLIRRATDQSEVKRLQKEALKLRKSVREPLLKNKSNGRNVGRARRAD